MGHMLIHRVRFAGVAQADCWVLVRDDKIEACGVGNPPRPAGCEEVDGDGCLLLPGVIDCHVHFREPGLTSKADIASESRAALAGGVTSYMDMPNTKPATTTLEAWRAKCELARQRSMANYAFFIGAANDNIDELVRADYSRIPGIKLFMGSSTGNMLVDDRHAIEEIFRRTRAIVAVHAEDQGVIDANMAQAKASHPDGIPIELHSRIRSAEACFKSTLQAVSLARQEGRRLHICHITTARELGLLERRPLREKLITAEVSPHHLLWCDEDYAAKGARIKMNPAVKSANDRDMLRLALEKGVIDMVATDHAPHLLADKEGDALTAASGAPLVQFSLPIMLGLFDERKAQEAMCENPAEIYRVKGRGRIAVGNYADLALVRETEPYVVTDAMAISKCGWTPIDGMQLRHRVEKTWVNGRLAYDRGDFAEQSAAMPLEFGWP